MRNLQISFAIHLLQEQLLRDEIYDTQLFCTKCVTGKIHTAKKYAGYVDKN
jgi:hypothetical protein